MGASLPSTANNNIKDTNEQEKSIQQYRIGDYVKITGLVENTELNGQLGVVIPKRNPFEQDRISVRVLYKKSKTQTGFSKKDISILATNLTRAKKPTASPKFTVVRKILAALYLKDRRARHIIKGNDKGAIRQEILKVLNAPDLLEKALVTGEKALKAHNDLATSIDALLLHMQKK